MNNSSKLIAFATLTVALLVPAVSAQDASTTENRPKEQRGERGPRGGRPMADMAEKLNLTEDQKPKFGAAMRNRMEKLQALRRDESLGGDERRTKMRAIIEESRAELEAILTPEQMKKLAELQAAGRRGGPGGGEKGAGRPRAEKP